MNRLSELKQLWNLSDILQIAQTPRATVFSAGDPPTGVLKMYTDVGWKDEKSGIEALKAWNGNGSVKLLESTKGAILMEFLEGDSLIPLSKTGRESEATEIFCDLIQELHSVDVETMHGRVPKLWDLFKDLMGFNPPSELSDLFQRAKQKTRHLFLTVQSEVLLHGDLHHLNVIKGAGGKYLAIDPKGFIGDPHYEIATILKNPWDLPEISQSKDQCLKRAADFATKLNMNHQRIVDFAFCHMCLSAMWALEHGDAYEHQIKVAKLLA